MNAIPARASRVQQCPVQTDDIEDVPDSYFDTRAPTSTRRYIDTSGNRVIQQENRRIVIHTEPPPKKHTKKRSPWMLLYIVIGMIAMLALSISLQMLGNWWAEHQLDGTYGFPRTYQVDAIVYPGDTSDHPSHYIFLNLNGTVEIIELPHSDSSHARIYKGPQIFSDSAPLVPVTGEFNVVGGKVEMVIHVGDQRIIYTNDGTQFKPAQ